MRDKGGEDAVLAPNHAHRRARRRAGDHIRDRFDTQQHGAIVEADAVGRTAVA